MEEREFCLNFSLTLCLSHVRARVHTHTHTHTHTQSERERKEETSIKNTVNIKEYWGKSLFLESKYKMEEGLESRPNAEDAA